MERQRSFQVKEKTMTKQTTGKRDDTPFHSAAREGNLELVAEMVSGCRGDSERLRELLGKMNQSGETALYVASECGHVNLVEEMIKYYDTGLAGSKARNGYDAFHVAAKQGNINNFDQSRFV